MKIGVLMYKKCIRVYLVNPWQEAWYMVVVENISWNT